MSEDSRGLIIQELINSSKRVILDLSGLNLGGLDLGRFNFGSDDLGGHGISAGRVIFRVFGFGLRHGIGYGLCFSCGLGLGFGFLLGFGGGCKLCLAPRFGFQLLAVRLSLIHI